MAIKITQQIKLGQRLALTQHMQQSLKILQLSLLDLHNRVQQELESNIMLEIEREAEKSASEDPERSNSETGSERDDDAPRSPEAETASMESIPDQLPIDSDWQDIYDDGPGRYLTEDWLQNVPADNSSLEAHLLEQIEFLNMSEEENKIARAIINAIDEKGYLRGDMKDIIAGVDGHPTLKQVESVLRRVQELDPPGVAARTPEECLLLQLEAREELTVEVKELSQTILQSHIELLTEADATSQLQARLNCDRENLLQAITTILDLDPHPGAAWTDDSDSRNMFPELFVKLKDNRWVVELNQEAYPRLRINSTYKSMIQSRDRSEHQASLRSHLREARWLIGAIKSRAQILLEIASCIIRYQEDFLKYGREYMKPLLLRQIAEELEVHESTVSRAVAGKSMHTPQGVYELSFFFPSRLPGDVGDSSSVAAKSIIKNLIDNEPIAQPLSDEAIRQAVEEDKGIKIARRTVAKYREALNIPSRRHRRRVHIK